MDDIGAFLLPFLEKQVLLAPILLLIIEEAGFPIPIADLVITFMGYQVSKGTLTFFQAYLLLLIADLMGASILYYVSAHYGHILLKKFQPFLHLDNKKLEWLEKKFKRYGAVFIIIGRHIPGMRVPVTVFSGISLISYPTFIASTFVSIMFWIPLYLALGKKLGPKTVELFHKHTHSSILIAILLVVIYILPFILLRKRKRIKTT